ncbi:putative disease resistance protein RGA3 [Nicotiana tabacum]|uniref:putative disease resistance protein RGA3 n=1 Tax=Nicotiana tabacum TaxID=4097 RepID=UPI003F4E5192
MKDESIEKAHKLKHDLLSGAGWRTILHKFKRVTSAKDIDGMGEKQQGLKFIAKQKDEEEMREQRSPLPPTFLGCPSTLLLKEMFDHNKAAVEQDKDKSSKMKDEIFEKAWNFEAHLRSCLHCCLFPDSYEFEKQTMVQLWVAEGFFEPEGDRMEDRARAHFDNLLEKEYVVATEFDSFGAPVKYKVTDAMHRFLQIAPQVGVSYLKVEETDQLGSVSEQMQHLFLISKNIKPTSFKILSRFKHLHTLVLLCEHGSSMGRVPQDLFYSVKQLRSLSLRRSGISEIPISIGSLKSLRYFDVSGTPIKCLPESIVRLQNLQTLKLDGCANLVGLPLKISKLANLRHLEFDLRGPMPVKMGNLTNLQTLRAFPVGTEDGCHIVELKHLVNLRESFCISRLENVLSSHEAKEAAMTNKKYIRELELRWGYRCSGSSKSEEEILDFLKPTACLQKLRILFYNGSIFPSWINNGSYLCNIVNLTLHSCRNCLVLPSLGGLPSLKVLYIVEFSEVRFIDNHFRRSYGNEVDHAFQS